MSHRPAANPAISNPPMTMMHTPGARRGSGGNNAEPVAGLVREDGRGCHGPAGPQDIDIELAGPTLMDSRRRLTCGPMPAASAVGSDDMTAHRLGARVNHADEDRRHRPAAPGHRVSLRPWPATTCPGGRLLAPGQLIGGAAALAAAWTSDALKSHRWDSVRPCIMRCSIAIARRWASARVSAPALVT